MAIFGSLSTVRAQTTAWPRLQAALEYVEKLARPGTPERAKLFALAAGESARVDLGDGLFAIDAAYPAKARTEVFFETHQKYIDVQAVLEGEEVMEVVDVARLNEDVPYESARDLTKYHDCPGASALRAQEGVIAVFFPVDGHMSHAPAAPGLVRKTVLKVPVG